MAGSGRLRDVGRHARNGRVLIVRDGHVEAGGRGVVRPVDGRVGHRRGAHGELITRAVGRGEGRHAAVVRRGWHGPGHCPCADSRVVGLGDVGRHVGDGRILVVGHRDREGGGGRVAGIVRGGGGHGRGAEREGRTGSRAVRDALNATVVARGRIGPRGHSGAESSIHVQVDVGHGVDGGVLGVLDGDRQALGRGVAALILGGEGHRIGSEVDAIEVGLAEGQGDRAASIGRTEVHIPRGEGGLPISVEGQGEILSGNGRSGRVLNGERGRSRRGVAGVIGGGEGHRHRTGRGALSIEATGRSEEPFVHTASGEVPVEVVEGRTHLVGRVGIAAGTHHIIRNGDDLVGRHAHEVSGSRHEVSQEEVGRTEAGERGIELGVELGRQNLADQRVVPAGGVRGRRRVRAAVRQDQVLGISGTRQVRLNGLGAREDDFISGTTADGDPSGEHGGEVGIEKVVDTTGGESPSSLLVGGEISNGNRAVAGVVVGPGQVGAVVRGGGASVGSEPGREIRGVAGSVALHRLVGGGRDGGILIVGHGHREAGRGRVARSILCRVGHRRGADGEGVSGIVGGGEARHATVVVRGRGRPAHIGAAQAGVIGHRDVGRHSGNGRGLGVAHRDGEAGRGHVAGRIRGRVGHRRGARGEGVAGAVAGRHGRAAVVGVRGLRPGDRGHTGIGVGVLRDVRRGSGNGRVLVVCHGDREARARVVSVDVRRGVGHRRGAHVEGVTTVVGGGKRADRAVVTGGGIGPRHNGIAHPSVCRLGDVGRHAGDGRILVVGHRHIEGAGGRIAVDVRRRVRHRRGADGKCVITIMCRGERADGTVVGCRQLRPGHHCAALTGIGRLRQIARISCDGGILVVGHGHCETGRRRVAGGVHGCVGHRRRAHREGISGVVGGRHGRGAVVRGGRSRPIHHGAAIACVGRLGDVGGHAGDGRGFVVGDGHREGRGRAVAAVVRRRVGHRRGSHRKRVARIVGGGEGVKGAVVRCRRSRPGHHCAAIACIGRLGDVGGRSGDDRIVRVCNGDGLGVGRGVAAVVDRHPRPGDAGASGSGSFRERHAGL